MLALTKSVQYSDYSYTKRLSPKVSFHNEHALIGVSPFNGYFTVENMERLFSWACKNFTDFHVFTMDKASKYNLMAIGYEENEAIKKTQKQDKNLHNKIIRSLTNIGFNEEESRKKILLISHLQENKQYLELYRQCIEFFENDSTFKSDCLNASRKILSEKMENVTDKALHLAVNYLLKELPVWFNTPSILDIHSSTFVYKDLPLFWRKICYNYGLISPKQELFIKHL